jgi:hypothetical protein
VLSALLLAAAPPAVVGQSSSASGRPATEYFHEAAQEYIAENVGAARRLVAAGLQQHPDDPRLRALKAKLDRAQPRSEADSSSSSQGGRSSQTGKDGPASSSSPPQASRQTPPRDGSQADDDGRQPPPGETNGANRDAPSSATGRPPDATSRSQAGRPQADRPQADRAQARRPQAERSPDDPSRGSRSRGDDAGAEAPARTAGGQAGSPGRPASNGPLSRAQAERILQALQGQEKQLLREVQKRSARPTPVEKDW